MRKSGVVAGAISLKATAKDRAAKPRSPAKGRNNEANTQ